MADPDPNTVLDEKKYVGSRSGLNIKIINPSKLCLSIIDQTYNKV